ncbi:MAG: TVP38/TMEM64 family protein [Alphaproteobacteria bacterium]|nr:TVP38/TMEM64 family protein [Alphaproteobacteria bacterium]
MSRFRRLIPLGILALAGLGFVAFGGRHYLTLAALAENRDWLAATIARAGAMAPVLFVLGYAALTALSVPGATVMTIAAGLLFGTWLGTLCAIVGASAGATAVFLAARAGLAGLAERAGPRVQRLEAGFRADALSYLLVLRLVPLFPFWLVNLVAGISGMRLSIYVLATVVGIVPGTFVYASLGNGLGGVIAQGRNPDLGLLFRPALLLPIVGLALLALIPVAYKRWQARRGRSPA